jgi:hypothetical protein
MSEIGPEPENDATFTPSLPETGLRNREPINDEPIELTDEEDRLRTRDVDPASDDVRRFMEAKGIPYGVVVKVRVGDRIFNMNTDPADFGTRVQ